MQLFSKKEAKNDYEEQKAAVILETVNITKALAEKLNDLNRLNDELKLRKLTSVQEFDLFMEPLTIKQKALETTVWELEKRKADALKPLNELEASLKAKGEWLEVRMQEIASKEFQTNQTHDEVAQTLREAKTSLAAASKEKEQAVSFKTDAEQKLKIAQAEAKLLKDQAEERLSKVAHEEETLERKRSALDYDRAALTTQEQHLEDKKKELQIMQNKVTDDRQRLASALELQKQKYGDKQLLPRRKLSKSSPRGRSKRNSSPVTG